MAKGRILIVENERFYQEFYRDVLEREGYKVEIVQAADEALDRVRHEAFDLVMADVVLRGSSGLELLADIKKADPARDVIMVTGMQSIRRAVDALKMGASDYLTKPVDKDELLLAVNRILERQVVRQEHSKLISENIHFHDLLRIQKKALALLTILDADKLAAAALETVCDELSAPGGVAFLRDAATGTWRAVAGRGAVAAADDDPAALFRTSSLKESLEEGRTLLESAEGDQWIPKGSEEGARLTLPLRHRHEILGAVRLSPRTGGRAYGPFDIDLGRYILEAAAAAMKNSLVVRRERDKAVSGEIPGTFSVSVLRSHAELQFNIARRYNRDVSLILCRLENYRAISASLKESIVRQVVDHFSATVLEVIRETDLMARLEEDLFAIIVPETDFYGAIMLKKRIAARLARVTYPVDLRRDFVPRVHLGFAACPRDGGHFQNLLEAAMGRLEEEGSSVYRRLGLQGKDFWTAVGRLLDPAIIEGVEGGGTYQAARLRRAVLSEANFHSLARAFIRDQMSFCASRGLLYLGLGTADPLSPAIADIIPRDNSKVSIFALGAKGAKMWNLPHITPVFIADPVLARHLFLLAVTEDISYAFFCRRGSGEALSGFHSCDDHLVLELITGLQEKYLLQRRIG